MVAKPPPPLPSLLPRTVAALPIPPPRLVLAQLKPAPVQVSAPVTVPAPVQPAIAIVNATTVPLGAQPVHDGVRVHGIFPLYKIRTAPRHPDLLCCSGLNGGVLEGRFGSMEAAEHDQALKCARDNAYEAWWWHDAQERCVVVVNRLLLDKRMFFDNDQVTINCIVTAFLWRPTVGNCVVTGCGRSYTQAYKIISNVFMLADQTKQVSGYKLVDKTRPYDMRKQNLQFTYTYTDAPAVQPQPFVKRRKTKVTRSPEMSALMATLVQSAETTVAPPRTIEPEPAPVSRSKRGRELAEDEDDVCYRSDDKEWWITHIQNTPEMYYEYGVSIKTYGDMKAKQHARLTQFQMTDL
jgi:hypothetical protein